MSLDGLIQCTGGGDKYKYNNGYNNKRIAVEMKSPFPNPNIPEEPYYKIPTWHVPQCLSEIAACEAEELWLIFITQKSVTLIIPSFSSEVWHIIYDIADDLYGPKMPKVQTCLHILIPQLKKKIKDFVENNSTFAM